MYYYNYTINLYYNCNLHYNFCFIFYHFYQSYHGRRPFLLFHASMMFIVRGRDSHFDFAAVEPIV